MLTIQAIQQLHKLKFIALKHAEKTRATQQFDETKNFQRIFSVTPHIDLILIKNPLLSAQLIIAKLVNRKKKNRKNINLSKSIN